MSIGLSGMKFLPKSKKRELMIRLTPIVGQITSDHFLTDIEIAKVTGVLPNRLSEYRNSRTAGTRPISEKDLDSLIQGGIVPIKEVMSKVPMSQEEKEFLERKKFLSNSKIMTALETICGQLSQEEMLKELEKIITHDN